MGNDNIAIAASFFSGLYVLQTLNFCWTGSFPTLLKFGISPSKIGCFMGDTGASMNYWVSWGIFLSFGLSFCGWTDVKAFIAPVFCTVIYTLAFAYTWYVKRFSGGVAFSLFILVLVPIVVLFVLAKIQDGEFGKFVCPIVSCFSSVCTFTTNSIIFHVVVFGHGNGGVRKLYFWLCMSALAYQFDSCMTAKVNGAQVAWYFFAMELSYFVIPLIHWTCERFHKALGVHDLNFFTVFWHVFAICIFTLMALEMWIVNVYLNWGGYSSVVADQHAGYSLLRCLSPFFMGIIGMGSIFWLFPVVWPFMVCHYSHFRFVMLLGPGLGSFATLIPWVLQDGDKIGIGGKDTTLFNIWSIYDFRGGWFYHFAWLVILLIFILFGIHMCCIHYPRCFVGRCILHSRWAVVFGSLLFLFTQLFKAVGLTGCFANAIGPWFIATVSGSFKTDASNTKISINSNNVTFGNQFKFDSSGLTLTLAGRDLKSGGTLKFDSSSKIQLIGIKDDAPIQSDLMDFSASTASLTVDTATANQHKFTKTTEFDISGSGTSKARGFQGADNNSNHFLTKIVYSGLTLSDGFYIDGFPVSGGAGKLTLGFPAKNYSSGFSLNGVSASNSSFAIEGDLAYGPTFGNVSFSCSLFHLTGALFTAQAYSVGIGSLKCAVDSGCLWPTRDIGGFRSFFWWLGYGLKNGNRRFRSLVYVDIIQVIS